MVTLYSCHSTLSVTCHCVMYLAISELSLSLPYMGMHTPGHFNP